MHADPGTAILLITFDTGTFAAGGPSLQTVRKLITLGFTLRALDGLRQAGRHPLALERSKPLIPVQLAVPSFIQPEAQLKLVALRAPIVPIRQG